MTYEIWLLLDLVALAGVILGSVLAAADWGGRGPR